MTPTEKRLAALEAAVEALLAGATDDAKVPLTTSSWTCDQCDQLLGIYDPDEDLMTRKHRDDISYLRLGEGGHVTAICRKCGHPNRLERGDFDGMRDAIRTRRRNISLTG